MTRNSLAFGAGLPMDPSFGEEDGGVDPYVTPPPPPFLACQPIVPPSCYQIMFMTVEIYLTYVCTTAYVLLLCL